jgi:hypothetical protein
MTQQLARGLSVLIFAALAATEADAVPDLSGPWGRNVLYLEPPASGPGPVTNRMKRPNGSMDGNALFGDDKNPILKPDSAEALKRHGAISLTGAAFANPHNQCQPEPTPFTLAIQFGVQIVQQKDEVLLLYLGDHKVRHVRMNATHPARLTPSWQGDSIGHYEGSTLVVDTVGMKTGPLAMVDQYGTPYTEALHVVERYRLIDGQTARDAQAEQMKVHPEVIPFPYGRGPIDPDPAKNGLQVEITVEDSGAFTMPWSARVTYRHVLDDWPEAVCAENFHEYYSNHDADIPRADKPDF